MHSHAFARVSVATVGMAVAAALFLVAPAHGASATVRWVSPQGKGTSCSQKKPCSLERALRTVRTDVTKMKADVIVRLTKGTYRRTSPIRLTNAHSGRKGHRVRIEAAKGAAVTVSGGQVVTRWRLVDRSKDIWAAAAPRGVVSRQLFVNGRRARMASGDAATVFGRMTPTATGYEVEKAATGTWSNLSGTELVYPGGGVDPTGKPAIAPWSWSSCGIARVNERTITMHAGCWQNARNGLPDLDGTPLPFITSPTTVQNNRALLDEPGEFYLDSRASQVYYKPRKGERLQSASTVMPRAAALVDADDVKNLSIKGIVFEHARYTPSTDLGVFTIQANVVAGRRNASPTDSSSLAVIPSALDFRRAVNVRLEGITVRRSGGGGISFNGGGQKNLIRGVRVHDVSSNGITVSEGLPLDHARSYETDTTIEHSAVHDVGREYLSAVGIMAGWVKRVRIRDNRVENVPHVGIGVGWGWMNASEMVDNHVERNLVRNAMSSSLDDGGAIYLQGGQGNARASTVLDNHIVGYRKKFGAIYLDSGASHWLVARNVVEGAERSSGWVYLQNIAGHGMAWSNYVTGNFVDTARQHEAPLGTHPTNKLELNTLARSAWPRAAQQTASSAGPKGTFAKLR